MLVTVSLGILKRSVQGVGSTFDLPLPDAKIKSIQRLAVGKVDKMRYLWDPAACFARLKRHVCRDQFWECALTP